MSNIRRYYLPNRIIFITQVVHTREMVFANPIYVTLLREKLRIVKSLHPFSMLGYVFLPDHFHLLIKPTGESNFSQIMHSLKPNFTKEYKKMMGITGSLKFWQKRFWDHVIRDEVDFEEHLHYIHYNPVKHGYVNKPEDWPDSSYLAWRERNVYPDQWGWTMPDCIKTRDWSMVE
ncbi:transposase [Anaerolineales bacterium HSG24]|nr:transposase [Anaerolineales bacterium HSG24]